MSFILKPMVARGCLMLLLQLNCLLLLECLSPSQCFTSHSKGCC